MSFNAGHLRRDDVERARPKVKPQSKYYVRRPVQMTYGPYLLDEGLIIPKLLNVGKEEAMIRLGYIEEYSSKESIECGECGNKFTNMQSRDRHYKKRHGVRRGPKIVNIEDLSEEQRQALKEEAASWETAPQQFMVGDPEDAEVAAEERRLEQVAPLHMDKTKASRR